jgi:CRISPR-associated protein (TIGR03986 family)
MTKEFYVNKIPQLLEKQHKHTKCEDAGNVCPGCRLFGMIGEKGSVKGRLCFSDASTKEPVEWLGWTPLPILGQPRISATEFYLLPAFGKDGKGERAKTWNYDYYYSDYPEEWNQKTGRTETLYEKSLYDAKLSGRKVYWHGILKRNDSKTNMNQTVRPINNGKFTFKVFFEDLTDAELDDLLFCLTLKGQGRHRIGRGKPIGMGSVSINVDSVRYREYGYDSEAGTVYAKYSDCIPIEDKNTKRTDAASAILRYATPLSEQEKAIVQYPAVKYPKRPGSEIYEWFTQNRGSVMKPTIKEILPPLLGGKKELPKHVLPDKSQKKR